MNRFALIPSPHVCKTRHSNPLIDDLLTGRPAFLAVLAVLVVLVPLEDILTRQQVFWMFTPGHQTASTERMYAENAGPDT